MLYITDKMERFVLNVRMAKAFAMRLVHRVAVLLVG